MRKKYTRRSFMGSSALALSAAVLAGSPVKTQKRSRLGLYLNLGRDPGKDILQVRDLGFDYCEIYNDNFDAAIAEQLIHALKMHQIRATALFAMGPGKMTWDFQDGPSTIGLVPRKQRKERVAHMKEASDFAKRCGISMVETHVGFIPENPRDPLYRETVEACREVASYCKANGQIFLYHAGQETPITQVRIIEDVGLDNQGVGLDTANTIMYGKGNPVEGLETYGKHIRAVNCKDGLFPKDPKTLGQETPIGEGRVDFARIFALLRKMDYQGPIHIEHEISGPQWAVDIRKSRAYLEKLLD